MANIKITLMVGVPGSGKSYVAQELLKKKVGDVIISSDEIRKEILGDETCQTENERVFAEYYKRMREYVEQDKNIILDATNINIKTRKIALDQIRSIKNKAIKVYAYVVNTPIETAIKQNEMRERKVPIEVLYKFMSMYQHPQKYEGFEEIYLHNHAFEVDLKQLVEIQKQMHEFEQENRHHFYKLGTHCCVLATMYLEKAETTDDLEDLVCAVAAKWHDVGKLFTKKYGEDGQAHYYNHAQVGTYYLVSHPNLFCGLSFEKFQRIIFYINFHMYAHDWCDGKDSLKYKNLFGEYSYNRLIEFAKFDRRATGTAE